jgi:hypothetical protein
MGNYDAVFNAVRSRMDYISAQNITEAIANKFEVSYQMEVIKDEFMQSAYDMRRPSMLLKPKLTLDGDSWCALYGDDIQSGVAGFGKSPELAMRDFDENFTKELT